jgi:hypothetical protein
MINLITAKCTIALNVYNTERIFNKRRLVAIRTALQSFIPG